MYHFKPSMAAQTIVIILFVIVLVTACSSRPVSPFTQEGVPLVLVPASLVKVEDKRGRFREKRHPCGWPAPCLLSP